MDKELLFKQALGLQRERVTSPRLGLFRIMVRKSPLTTATLIAEAEKLSIDQATCYRNLALFRRIGLISDIVVGGRRMVELTDSFGAHHHHFSCRNCGRLIDFDSPSLETAISAAAADLGAIVSSHQLEIIGVCAQCRGLT